MVTRWRCGGGLLRVLNAIRVVFHLDGDTNLANLGCSSTFIEKSRDFRAHRNPNRVQESADENNSVGFFSQAIDPHHLVEFSVTKRRLCGLTEPYLVVSHKMSVYPPLSFGPVLTYRFHLRQ